MSFDANEARVNTATFARLRLSSDIVSLQVRGGVIGNAVQIDCLAWNETGNELDDSGKSNLRVASFRAYTAAVTAALGRKIAVGDIVLHGGEQFAVSSLTVGAGTTVVGCSRSERQSRGEVFK